MQSAYDAFQEGNRLLASQNPHAAVIALERARDLEPDKGSVRETLARAYFRTGRFAQAGEEFGRAVEIEPVNDYAHFGLGLCLMRRGDRIGARRHLKLAVAMRPDQADYRAALERVADERRRDRRDRRWADAPVVACDLDGVVWRGDEPIAPAAAGIAALRAAGLRVAFVSNNSNSPVGDVVAKLDRMGVPADPTTSSPARWPRPGCSRSRSRRAPACCVCARAGRARGARRRTAWKRSTTARPTRSSSASTASSTTTPSTGPRPRCAPARASSPPTSTPPIRSPAG